jgi:uncharacterized membrane protein YkvA (DUF1232 family)
MRNNAPTMFVLVTAPLYILSPIDFIPDVLLVICWADDVLVVMVQPQQPCPQTRVLKSIAK